MKSYADVTLFLSTHAHKQYRERVEEKSIEKLTEVCRKQLAEGDYGHNKDWFIHLGGVWWVYEMVDPQTMLLITCYGRTTANLPRGLKWAIQHNDRINLVTLSGIGVLPP